MELVSSVTAVNVIQAAGSTFGAPDVFVSALGTVPTTGWSSPTLVPVVYVTPPADGIWDIYFMADRPAGIVLEVVTPVGALLALHAPDWFKGIRVIARTNSIEEKPITAEVANFLSHQALTRHSIVEQRVASYEDSWQIIGTCGGLSLKMKKLKHDLILVVEGPDEGQIRHCIEQSLSAGIIAAIVAAFGTGGAALPAALAAAQSALLACLGASYSVTFHNRSHWEEWCT